MSILSQYQKLMALDVSSVLDDVRNIDLETDKMMVLVMNNLGKVKQEMPKFEMVEECTREKLIEAMEKSVGKIKGQELLDAAKEECGNPNIKTIYRAYSSAYERLIQAHKLQIKLQNDVKRLQHYRQKYSL